MTGRIVMLGAGGHARVLVAALRTQSIKVSGCIARERPEASWPAEIEYLGPDHVLQELRTDETTLVNGIGSTRSTELRQRLYELGKKSGFKFLGVRHTAACVDDSVEMGEGVQLMAGAIVQCGAVIGDNAIVNTGALVDHDCRIGAHAQVAPGACLAGGVQIGTGAHVGIGAKVIQGITVGQGALIAAGAVVIRDVAPGAAVAGVPAKPIHSSERAARGFPE